jgi:hypothetical protein
MRRVRQRGWSPSADEYIARSPEGMRAGSGAAARLAACFKLRFWLRRDFRGEFELAECEGPGHSGRIRAFGVAEGEAGIAAAPGVA